MREEDQIVCVIKVLTIQFELDSSETFVNFVVSRPYSPARLDVNAARTRATSIDLVGGPKDSRWGLLCSSLGDKNRSIGCRTKILRIGNFWKLITQVLIDSIFKNTCNGTISSSVLCMHAEDAGPQL